MKKRIEKVIAVSMSVNFLCMSMATVFANEKLVSFVPDKELLSTEINGDMPQKEQKVIVKFKDDKKRGNL